MIPLEIFTARALADRETRSTQGSPAGGHRLRIVARLRAHDVAGPDPRTIDKKPTEGALP